MCGLQDFTHVSGCVCPGYNTVFKCTAVGNGFTQWSGSAFDCEGLGNEIFLSHDDFNRGIRKECNNGAIVGHNLRVNGSCYTSQLTVNISTHLNGTTIDCTYDTGSVLEPIGSTNIVITTDPFPPPENLQLIDMEPGKLTVSWTPTAHAPLCSALSYDIQSDCGECPTATSSTSAICTFESAHPRPCTFAVRSVVCGNIVGSWSYEIEVMLRVPDPPVFTEILSRYDPNNLVALDIKFNHSYEDSFNISTGFDGSIAYYNVNFSDSITHDTCGSVIISSATCSNYCAASLPLSCFPLSGNIIISVSASNRLGEGQSNSIDIDTTNQYVSVTAESGERIIMCEFLNQQDVHKERKCTVLYGRCTERLTHRAQGSTRDGSLISIQLPDITDSDIQNYCYAAVASNDTFSVSIGGKFSGNGSGDTCDVSPAAIIILTWSNTAIQILLVLALFSTIYYIRFYCHSGGSREVIQEDQKESIASLEDHEPVTVPETDHVELSNLEGNRGESFYAHVHFDLEHKPWELLNALKIFKNKNIVDIRIIRLNHGSKKIYARFQETPSLIEAENYYKELQEMNPKVAVEPGEFIDMPDESEMEGYPVFKYKRKKVPNEPGSLCKLLEGIRELAQRNGDYGLINITGITVKPSDGSGSGSKDIELRFILELPTNWKEEFDMIPL